MKLKMGDYLFFSKYPPKWELGMVVDVAANGTRVRMVILESSGKINEDHGDWYMTSILLQDGWTLCTQIKPKKLAKHPVSK